MEISGDCRGHLLDLHGGNPIIKTEKFVVKSDKFWKKKEKAPSKARE